MSSGMPNYISLLLLLAALCAMLLCFVMTNTCFFFYELLPVLTLSDATLIDIDRFVIWDKEDLFFSSSKRYI